MILDSVLECIGGTPVVRLNRIPKEEGLSCEIRTYIEKMIILKAHYF